MLCQVSRLHWSWRHARPRPTRRTSCRVMNLGLLPQQETEASQVILQQASECAALRYRDRIETLTRSFRRLADINPLVVDGALALLLFALVEASADNRQRWVSLSVAIVALETLPLTF